MSETRSLQKEIANTILTSFPILAKDYSLFTYYEQYGDRAKNQKKYPEAVVYYQEALEKLNFILLSENIGPIKEELYQIKKRILIKNASTLASNQAYREALDYFDLFFFEFGLYKNDNHLNASILIQVARVYYHLNMHDDGLRCFELAQSFLSSDISPEKMPTETNAVTANKDIQHNIKKEVAQYTKKARSYAKLGLYDLAIEACDHLLSLNKDDNQALTLKSDCLDKKNTLDETCLYFKKHVGKYQKKLNCKSSGCLSFFYNQDLIERKKEQARQFSIAIEKAKTASDISLMLQLYRKKDDHLSKLFHKSPGTFSDLLDDLSLVANKRCIK